MQIVLNDNIIHPVLNREVFGGMQVVYRFDNGFGASIIHHSGSYGVELAVVEWEFWNSGDDEYELCYDTPITGDVMGWMTYGELVEVLGKVKALPVRENMGEIM